MGGFCVGFTFLCAWIAVAVHMTRVARRTQDRVRIGWQLYEDGERFRERFGAAIGLWGTRDPKVLGAPGVQFSGPFEGRQAHMSFTRVASKNDAQACIARLAVAADDAPALVVTREDWSTWIAKLIHLKREVEVGVPAFDEKFLLETTDRRAIDWLMHRADFREQIEEVFRVEAVRSLTLGAGSLAVTADTHLLSDHQCRALLRNLVAIARAFERVNVDVRVLGGERRALRGSSAHARCGYCHEDVTGEEPDLVACDRCSTIAHAECWTELGRCPVIGCAGRSPERARAG
jgi:hypothetical protein